MTTRVRYSKSNNGVLRSVKTYQHPTNGARLFVLLNTNDNTFKVCDEMADSLTVRSGTGDNLHDLKMEAKRALSELGIVFGSESRGVVKLQAVS